MINYLSIKKVTGNICPTANKPNQAQQKLFFLSWKHFASRNKNRKIRWNKNSSCPWFELLDLLRAASLNIYNVVFFGNFLSTYAVIFLRYKIKQTGIWPKEKSFTTGCKTNSQKTHSARFLLSTYGRINTYLVYLPLPNGKRQEFQKEKEEEEESGNILWERKDKICADSFLATGPECWNSSVWVSGRGRSLHSRADFPRPQLGKHHTQLQPTDNVVSDRYSPNCSRCDSNAPL